MGKTQAQEKAAVEAGYWHLFRYNPLLEDEGKILLPSTQKSLTGVNSRISFTPKSDTLHLSRPSRGSKNSFKVAEENAKRRYTSYKRLAAIDFSKTEE
jgi:pyruvate-ferredoxin/flavodoxin oxidoreductase